MFSISLYVSFNSKWRQKAIDMERRKQALRRLRASASKPFIANSNKGRVPTQNVTDEYVSMAVVNEDSREKRRRKHKTERYVNGQQEQFKNEEERGFT